MPLASLSLAEYQQRLYERKAAERLLQEAIEAALDVNAHIIAEQGARIPDDYFGGFTMLAELLVLPRDLAESLAPSAGLRNRIVHDYGGLDDARVLSSMSTLLDLYPRYVQAVEAYLSAHGL